MVTLTAIKNNALDKLHWLNYIDFETESYGNKRLLIKELDIISFILFAKSTVILVTASTDSWKYTIKQLIKQIIDIE